MNYLDKAAMLTLTDPANQIPMIAAKESDVWLSGVSNMGKKFVAEAIHNFSMRAEKMFLVLDLNPGTPWALEPKIIKPFDLAFSELYRLLNLGYGTNLVGGTIWIENLQGMELKNLTLIIGQLKETLKCRIIVDIKSQPRNAIPLQELHSYFEKPLVVKLIEMAGKKDLIMFFANYFLAKENLQSFNRSTGFEADAEAALIQYKWPGNYPELERVIRETMFIENCHSPIRLKALPAFIREPPKLIRLKNASFLAEMKIIEETLKKNHYNKKKTAEDLQISRKTLYTKIKQSNRLLENNTNLTDKK